MAKKKGKKAKGQESVSTNKMAGRQIPVAKTSLLLQVAMSVALAVGNSRDSQSAPQTAQRSTARKAVAAKRGIEASAKLEVPQDIAKVLRKGKATAKNQKRSVKRRAKVDVAETMAASGESGQYGEVGRPETSVRSCKSDGATGQLSRGPRSFQAGPFAEKEGQPTGL
jgi:hypothetical protein